MNKEKVLKISLEILSLLLIAAAFFFAVSGSMGGMNAGQSEQDGTENNDELKSSFAEDTDKEEENASQSGESSESDELSQDATEATVGIFEISRYENERTAVWDTGRLIDVPYINQREDFPNGCESVSAVMALQYLGVDIDANTFIEEYLDMGSSPYYVDGVCYACDPREQFPGDPRLKSGWGCYPEVIKKAIDKMKLPQHKAFIVKGAEIPELCTEYIDKGIPVVFWATIDMIAPSQYVTWNIEGTDRQHTWINPFHCVLLVGYDEEYYYFNDPMEQKNMRYPKEKVERAYKGIGSEALVVLEKGQKIENTAQNLE